MRFPATSLAFLLAIATTNAIAQPIVCAAPPGGAADCLRQHLHELHGDAGIDVVAQEPEPANVLSLRLLREGLVPRLPVAAQLADGSERTLWYRVQVYRDVLVWTRDADAGRRATAGHAKTERIDVVGWLQGTDRPVAELGNARLKRSVRAGMPVLQGDLLAANSVSHGDVVAYRVQSGPITLHGKGRALEDGQVGQVLRILPSHGNQPIQAIVAEKP